VRCVCPVCNQPGDYPERYAHKWHRCVAGCQAAGTRLWLVPDGVARLSPPGVDESSPARFEPRSLALGAAAALLLGLPFVADPGSGTWLGALLAGGVGAGVLAALARR